MVTEDIFVKVDHVGIHENLIDLMHFPFVHPNTVYSPEYTHFKFMVLRGNNQVVIRRELKNSRPSGVCCKPADIIDKKVDRASEARFVSAALHTAFVRVWVRVHDMDPGKPELYRYNITHVFTPETNNSIHY